MAREKTTTIKKTRALKFIRGRVFGSSMNHPGVRLRTLCAIAVSSALSAACSTTAILPAALSSPDHGVVCDSGRGSCFDRFGPSIGLTEVFLGANAARALTAALRERPPILGPDAEFSPAEDIACRRETGPCRTGETVHEALTAVLYGPRPATMRGAAAPAIVSVEWHWNVSRYSNDTASRPADPGRYRLRLDPDGSLRVRADCNQVGGRYRIDGSRIAIKITHSTMAACVPESLDYVFRRDLDAAAIYFVRQGRLYVDLKNDAGTMEFGPE